MGSRAEIIKKEIDEIRRKQVSIEKTIAKYEEDDIYDDSLYSQLDKLEKECDTLQAELDELE